MRLCACGCGTSLAGMRQDAKYASAACRTRIHRQRRERAGKPSRRRNRSTDLRISYRKAVEQLAYGLRTVMPGGYIVPIEEWRRSVAGLLEPCLTDRQRAAAAHLFEEQRAA